MSETRQKILDTARALFNEQGLHRVGVRDIARALEISPGNLAYHFATKDDLVSALVSELHAENARHAFGALPADFSLVTLYQTALTAMRAMLGYRFVLLDYVDAVTASPELQRLESKLAPGRRRRNDEMIARLVDDGFLKGRSVRARGDVLYEQGRMISSGWLADALLAGMRDDRTILLHYAKVGCALLEPYCTKKGARQMRELLAGEHDDEAMRASKVRPPGK